MKIVYEHFDLIWKLTGTSHKLDGSNTFSKCGHFFKLTKTKSWQLKPFD